MSASIVWAMSPSVKNIGAVAGDARQGRGHAGVLDQAADRFRRALVVAIDGASGGRIGEAIDHGDPSGRVARDPVIVDFRRQT